MGGRSSSNQSTSNAQHTNNIVNDGDYAGVGGSVAHDESSLEIDEAFNTTTETSWENAFNTDNSQTSEFDESFNTDNSVVNENDNRVDYDDSFNTDNSVINENDNRIVNDGQFAGVSTNGDINVLDSNSLEVAETIALSSLESNAFVVDKAFEFGGDAIEEVSGVAGHAINEMNDNSKFAMREVADNSRYAINSVNDFGQRVIGDLSDVSNNAMQNVTDIGAYAIGELEQSTESFSDNLAATTQAAMATNSQILEQNAANNTQDKAIIAELAKNTSLQGQDIVAKTSEKMTMYMALAVGVLGLAFVAMSMRGGK